MCVCVCFCYTLLVGFFSQHSDDSFKKKPTDFDLCSLLQMLFEGGDKLLECHISTNNAAGSRVKSEFLILGSTVPL